MENPNNTPSDAGEDPESADSLGAGGGAEETQDQGLGAPDALPAGLRPRRGRKPALTGATGPRSVKGQGEEQARQVIMDKMRRDLLFFGRIVNPGMFTVASPPFHLELAERLIAPTAVKLNVIAPRGHAKSSLAAGLLPLWHLCFHDGPKFVVLVSKTQGHANRLLQSIKDIIEFSVPFRALFGYWGKHAARKWTDGEVTLPDGSVILTRGASQQMRGLKVGNQRPTLVVYDDPEDENNTKTEEAIHGNLMNLLKGVVPGLDPRVGRVVLIGTPIKEQSMVLVVSRMEGWETLRYKALMGSEGRYRALWPEVWPVERLLAERKALEDIGRVSAFYSEMQCEIVGDSDQLFRREDLHYWEGEVLRDRAGEHYLKVVSIDGREAEKNVPVNLFMGVDPASSTSARADYTAIVVIAMDRDKNVYVVDYVRKRMKPLDVAQRIMEMYRRYRPKKTQIETVGYQEMLRQYLREHGEEHIPGLEIKNNPRKDKLTRLEGLQPEVARGKWHLMERHIELEEEMVVFPRAAHDDLLDGIFYARKGAYPPYHDAIVEEAPKRPPRRMDWFADL